jgi:hypothetical protein
MVSYALSHEEAVSDLSDACEPDRLAEARPWPRFPLPVSVRPRGTRKRKVGRGDSTAGKWAEYAVLVVF